MDIASPLKPDIYRSLVVILIPGFVAAAPWVGGVFWPELQLASTWKDVTIPIAVTMFIIVVAVGVALEDIGSSIEVRWADAWLHRNWPRTTRLWARYLSCRPSPSLIAVGYLKYVLIRFKFELSMVSATAIGATGLMVAEWFGSGLGGSKSYGLAAVLVAGHVMLWGEIRRSAALAVRVRRTIVRAR